MLNMVCCMSWNISKGSQSIKIYLLKIWKLECMEKVQFLDKISFVYKIKSMLIVLVSSEYYFTFNTNKINMVHVDDNLISGRRNSPTPCNCWLVAESERRNQNTPSRKGLTCYDYCYYTAQSDTGCDNADNKKAAGIHTCTHDMLKRGGKL